MNVATVRVQILNTGTPVNVYEEYEGGTSYVGSLWDAESVIEVKVYEKKRVLIEAVEDPRTLAQRTEEWNNELAGTPPTESA